MRQRDHISFKGNLPAGRNAVLLLLLLACLLTACLGGGNEGGEAAEFVPNTLGTLVCSEQCAARGQCGSAGNGDVVLLKSDGPAVSGHDLTAPADSNVQLTQKQTRRARTVLSLEEINVDFYLVLVEGGAPVGWVPAWCVQTN